MAVVGTRRVIRVGKTIARRRPDDLASATNRLRRRDLRTPLVETIGRIARDRVDPGRWERTERTRAGARRGRGFCMGFGDGGRESSSATTAMQRDRPAEVGVVFRGRMRSWRHPPPCRRRGDRGRFIRLAKQKQQRRFAVRLGALGGEMQPTGERHAEAAAVGHHRRHPATPHRLLDRPRPRFDLASRRIEAPRSLEQPPIEVALSSGFRRRQRPSGVSESGWIDAPGPRAR